MGTAKHLVEQVVMDDLEEPELMAPQTRLLRQQDLGVDTRVDVSMLIVNTTESARAMSTLMQYCHRVIVQQDLFIEADIGKEGRVGQHWQRRSLGSQGSTSSAPTSA